MIYETINLYGDRSDVTVTCYIAEEAYTARDAMLVLPGGGYIGVCADREGEPIALAYLAAGINAFVLHYSVGDRAIFPQPLLDASAAMAYIKNNAGKYHINPNRVFTVGFSAGGHLAAALGTLWHIPDIYSKLDIPFGYNKPAGMILCYAVLSASVKAHIGCFHNILGTETPTQEQLDMYSPDKKISEHTVPAFIMHTASDTMAPVEDALYFAEALSEKGMPFELHIYPKGSHGVALGSWQTARDRDDWINPSIEKWVSHSIEWIKSQK